MGHKRGVPKVTEGNHEIRFRLFACLGTNTVDIIGGNMGRVVCILMLLFANGASLFGDDSVGQQLLKTSSDQVDIRSDGRPFRLEADFTAHINVPQNGHLTWQWMSKNLWSQEIVLGEYRQLNIRKGDTLYISRNLPFTPSRITELLDLLVVLSADADEWLVKKTSRQVNAGIAAECMEVHARERQLSKAKKTVCVDPSTMEVLSIETKDETDLRRKEFNDYQSFRDHRYPRQLHLFVNGSLGLKVQINSLSDQTFDEAAFIPPAGAIARRQCEHMAHPQPLKTPDPAYPRSAAQNHLGGTVTVSLTVLPDGSVENVQLVGSAGHEMDQVTQEILKTWKFKPAMCGDEPVASDLRVEVNFRVR